MASSAGQYGEARIPATSSSGVSTRAMKRSTASPRRPPARATSSRSTYSRQRRGQSSAMLYGTSYTAILSIAGHAAAASRTRAPPDETPNRGADPPAVASRASMSSISRSRA
jgi:hypothetical protein